MAAIFAGTLGIAAIAETTGLIGVGGLIGLLLLGGATVYYLEAADDSEPPVHAPRDDELYPCPKWLPTTGQFNWGLVGESGTGKSTLINALRGLRAWEKELGAAAVDVCECTMEPTPYRFRAGGEGGRRWHPNLEKITIWDLPGCGTSAFPAETYVKTMGLRYFDGIVIVTANRFTETDLMLMRTLKGFHVPFFMVRNKVDIDIEQNEEANDTGEEATMAAMRAFMVDTQGITDNLYLVAAAKALKTRRGVQLKLDFDLLLEDLVFEMSKGRTPVRAPQYWEDRALEGNMRTHVVPPDFRAALHKRLLDTDHCGVLRGMRIVSLTRVENPRAFKRYAQTKSSIIEKHRKARRPLPIPPLSLPAVADIALDAFVNEAWLWHGTTASKVHQIMAEGFDEYAPGSMDQMLYGAGTYFSTEPCKAMQSTDTSGSRFLLLCRVILGQPYFPTGTITSTFWSTPCIVGCRRISACQHPPADSVIANPGIPKLGRNRQRHRELIVFDPGQAYPEFMVEVLPAPEIQVVGWH